MCIRWNTFRSLCDWSKKLDVLLEVTADLPEDEMIQRWLAEPVKAVLVSTSLFLTNKKGYPVLSKAHQAVLRSFFKVRLNTLTLALALQLSSEL